jgi:hypothetical protein
MCVRLQELVDNAGYMCPKEPVKRLLERSRRISLVQRPRLSTGICPDSWFLCSERTWSSARLSMLLGMLPESMLPKRSSSPRFVELPMDGGISPIKALLDSTICSRYRDEIIDMSQLGKTCRDGDESIIDMSQLGKTCWDGDESIIDMSQLGKTCRDGDESIIDMSQLGNSSHVPRASCKLVQFDSAAKNGSRLLSSWLRKRLLDKSRYIKRFMPEMMLVGSSSSNKLFSTSRIIRAVQLASHRGSVPLRLLE